ncbi:MAG: RHS repeat-associated core domain-containing protein, partial [Chlamydiota bacterium]
LLLFYAPSGLPIRTETLDLTGFSLERFAWDKSGKLMNYNSTSQKKTFGYLPGGTLHYAGEEIYEFSSKNRLCLQGPHLQIDIENIDSFGRPMSVMIKGELIEEEYNNAGELTRQGEKTLEWDPWGKLINVSSHDFTWQAVYDPFGRRIQTNYTQNSEETITTTFYDPEKEFEEIGVKIGSKVYWKFYGPSACDAVSCGSDYFILKYNSLGQLEALITSKDMTPVETLPTAYGPIVDVQSPKDLRSFALALSWRSKAQDPTGFIWMGARYYDPKTAKFLKPDPLGHPICIGLYSYALGDPINYTDPDGRFASQAYNSIKSVILEDFHPSRYRQLAIAANNNYYAKLADDGLSKSTTFTVGSRRSEFYSNIIFINGINNTEEDARESANYLSNLGEGVKISVVYNPMSYKNHRIVSGCLDVLEGARVSLGPDGYAGPFLERAVQQSLQSDPEKYLLIIAHSKGNIDAYNVLSRLDKQAKQKVIFSAVAPAKIIPDYLCKKSFNYTSTRDFVSYLDIYGMLEYGNELQVLKAHENAPTFDHALSSPTFQECLTEIINGQVETRSIR